MRSFFRLLLWLSITVLSLQGGAAAAIGQAGTMKHGSMSAAVHEAHQAAQHAGSAHCCELDSKLAQSHAKCVACASCCVGCAPPPSLSPGFHALPLSSSPPANAEAGMTSFVPAALERPPQALSV